jgi:hypothetical protein
MEKYLLYELFSGVGFCNQLFSLETAIYLANISNRKLILFIKNPLCHCGSSSWNYGKFMEFFSDDYLKYLPNGIEVYYGRNIPPTYNKIINDKEQTKHLIFGNNFSQLGFIDNDIFTLYHKDVNNININKFLNGRKPVILDIHQWTSEYIYLTQSNASRCFSNFLTTSTNYQIMSNICESLTHLHESFYYIYKELQLPDKYIGIHFRFGDSRISTQEVNNRCTKETSYLINTIEKYNDDSKNIIIMSDRKDTDYLNNIQEKFGANITYTEDMIKTIDFNKYISNISDYKVVSFLIQKYICEQSNVFIGYKGSTVSHYIHYINYINNKSYSHYVNTSINIDLNVKYNWNTNNIRGGAIGWQIFFPDNIYKISDNKHYIKTVYQNLVNKTDKKIISFSLYGIGKARDEKRNFLKGLYVNYELAKQIYPDWICRVYIPSSESYKYIEPLLELSNLEVIIVDTNTCLRALRFLPCDDKNVSVWISRDLDSVLNWREKACIDEWLQKDEQLHIMSDNRQHTWNIAGGMFGLKNNFKINYTNSLLKLSSQYTNQQDSFAIDCKITDDIFFNNYSQSYIQHYSSGKKLDNNLPFPSHNSIDSVFVGNIVDINKYYKQLRLDEKYRLTNKVNLFNLDLHISVIEDIKNVFTNISNDIEITDWSISGHTWVFNKTKQSVKHVNADSWKKIDTNMISKFQEEYNDYLSTFDGFIVTHTPVFCLLFEKYKKPIFMINSCRYVQPYCWNNGRNDNMLNELNKSLIRMYESGQLIPISNNKGDQRFLELGTNIKSTHLPSLCLYTNSKYTGKNGKIIVTGTTRKDLLPNIENIVYKDDLGGRYKWSTLYDYKAIIVLPYEISTMSIFEYYSANVPMIFPSKTFLTELIRTGKYPRIGSKYFQFKHPDCFNEALNTGNSPPVDSFIEFWLNNADYYDINNMPHILFFDSYDELQDIINNTDFMSISSKMVDFNNNIRIPSIVNSYRSIIQKTFPTLSLNKIDVIKYGPMSGYNNTRNQKGIETYLQQNIKKSEHILEIGPSGGQWSKLLSSISDLLYCVDEKSAEQNYFWNYIQKNDKIKYIQGFNTISNEIQDNSLDYIFSYDVFKYTSYDEMKIIIQSLYKKCKIGCKLLISYGDIYKFIKSEPHRVKNFEKEFNVFNDIEKLKKIMEDDYNGEKRQGRWYWIGIQKCIDICEKIGFTLIERDLNIDKTNPLTLFTKK